MKPSRMPCWSPNVKVKAVARLTSLMRRLDVPTYPALHAKSVDEPQVYWTAVMRDLGWQLRHPWHDFCDTSRGAPFARFFAGAQLNWVDNFLARAGSEDGGSRPAMVCESESGRVEGVTYRELARMCLQLAGGLRELGIRPGDRVGLMLTQGVEAAATLLALSALGAVTVPLFTGFGVEAVCDRLDACRAVALVLPECFQRRGRVATTKVLREGCRARVRSLKHLVLAGASAPIDDEACVRWRDLLQADPIDRPASVPGEHPFMVMFTSGTTGKPKGTVHTHGGFPLKVTHDAAYLFDLNERDRWFWPSDMGWVVGPLTTVSSLCLGATLVVYDGAPDVPTWHRFTDVITRHEVTHFGASPTLLRAFAAAGVSMPEAGRLRVLISAGEVLDAEHFDWYFRAFGQGRLPVINYTGGTEASGALLSNVVLLPIRPAGFNAVAPGVSATVVNDEGVEVIGQVGELALRMPFIGMTSSFWEDDERYLDSYWRQQPGLWMHGDLALHDTDGHYVLLGRSDDTLKIAGKRVGPSEVEAAVLDGSLPVAEAAAVGLPDPQKGQQLVVCVVPLPGEVEAELGRRVQEKVELAMGRAFRPARVLFVSELPRTRNAKVMRRVIRRVLGGEPVGDLSALENPQAVALLQAHVLDVRS